VNGILKGEFDLYSSNVGFKETTKKIQANIEVYNTLRPHANCDYLTPKQAHLVSGELKKRWKHSPGNKVKNAACITQIGITNSSV
jgi:putative transposase